MSPVKRDYILYLEDMLQAIERIEEYFTGLDFTNGNFKQIISRNKDAKPAALPIWQGD